MRPGPRPDTFRTPWSSRTTTAGPPPPASGSSSRGRCLSLVLFLGGASARRAVGVGGRPRYYVSEFGNDFYSPRDLRQRAPEEAQRRGRSNAKEERHLRSENRGAGRGEQRRPPWAPQKRPTFPSSFQSPEGARTKPPPPGAPRATRCCHCPKQGCHFTPISEDGDRVVGSVFPSHTSPQTRAFPEGASGLKQGSLPPPSPPARTQRPLAPGGPHVGQEGGVRAPHGPAWLCLWNLDVLAPWGSARL